MSVEVLGSINMDIVLTVNEIPRPGVTTLASRQRLFPGGKGANQAVASARCGVNTTMIGAVGDDEFGTTMTSFLENNGVHTGRIQLLPGEKTGQAYISVDRQGENSIVVLPGANHAFSIQATANNKSEDSLVRLVQFEVPLVQIEKFFSKKQGLNIINAAPADQDGKALLDLADFVVVNEPELAFLTNQPGADFRHQSDVISAARVLLANSSQWVVVTLGPRGSIAISNTEVIAVPGIQAKVVDTTGAGDCFCGALAAYLSEGDDINAALRFANAAASLAVTKNGAGSSMPYKIDIDSLLENSEFLD